MDTHRDQEASQPVACTLGTDEIDNRVAAWRRLGQQAQIARERTGTRVTLTYRPAPGVAEQLDALIALERDCCGFLHFHTGQDDDTIVLEIEGPKEAVPILEMFASDPHA